MNAGIDRDLIAQAAITIAVCAGAWTFWVKSKVQAADTLALEVAVQEQQREQMQQSADEGLAERAAKLRGRIAEIREANVLASDSSAMYRLVMDVAGRFAVEVQNLQPMVGSPSTGDDTIVISQIDVTVHGGFEETARFAEALAQVGPFLRPRMVEVSPIQADDRTNVSMRLNCGVLSFALPEALGEVGAGNVDS